MESFNSTAELGISVRNTHSQKLSAHQIHGPKLFTERIEIMTIIMIIMFNSFTSSTRVLRIAVLV